MIEPRINLDLTEIDKHGYEPEDQELVMSVIDNYLMSTVFPIVNNLVDRMNTSNPLVLTRQEREALVLISGIRHKIDPEHTNLDHFAVQLLPAVPAKCVTSKHGLLVFSMESGKKPKLENVILAPSPLDDLARKLEEYGFSEAT